MFLPCVHMTMKLLGHRLLKMSSRVEFLKACVWSLNRSFTFLKTMMMSAGSPFSSLFFIFIFEQKRFSSAYWLRLPTAPSSLIVVFCVDEDNSQNVVVWMQNYFENVSEKT